MSKNQPEFDANDVARMTDPKNLQPFVDASKGKNRKELAIKMERKVREVEKKHVISKRSLERVINI